MWKNNKEKVEATFTNKPAPCMHVNINKPDPCMHITKKYNKSPFAFTRFSKDFSSFRIS